MSEAWMVTQPFSDTDILGMCFFNEPGHNGKSTVSFVNAAVLVLPWWLR